MDWARGAVPTRQGPIDVDLKRDGDRMVGDVRAPLGVVIDVAAAPDWRVSAGPGSFEGQARVTFVRERDPHRVIARSV
ncbi:MAG: hypothetical protein ACKPBA_15250 [Planctomycetota bacterium]